MASTYQIYFFGGRSGRAGGVQGADPLRDQPVRQGAELSSHPEA